mgnify:CR=1 FL=1
MGEKYILYWIEHEPLLHVVHGLRQHFCFINARLFLRLPAKNQINPKVLMLLLSLCRLVNVVGVGCTPALSEAGRLKLLSCRRRRCRRRRHRGLSGLRNGLQNVRMTTKLEFS